MTATSQDSRQRMCFEIMKAWRMFPDLRLGQLIVNSAAFARRISVPDVFYCSDEELIQGLRKMSEASNTPSFFANDREHEQIEKEKRDEMQRLR